LATAPKAKLAKLQHFPEMEGGLKMAKASGRRSAADLTAKRLKILLEPTRKLSAAEHKVWNGVTGSFPPGHFTLSDAELLGQYCAIVVAFETSREAGDIATMEKLGRLALSYATRLRATPQSRYDTKLAARQAERGGSNAAAHDRLIGGDAWDE
jgi:hypothetical protein